MSSKDTMRSMTNRDNLKLRVTTHPLVVMPCSSVA